MKWSRHHPRTWHLFSHLEQQHSATGYNFVIMTIRSFKIVYLLFYLSFTLTRFPSFVLCFCCYDYCIEHKSSTYLIEIHMLYSIFHVLVLAVAFNILIWTWAGIQRCQTIYVDLFRAYPIDEIPARTRQAAAIIHMILNNLDPHVAQFPQELVTYGGNGQVFSNWAQVCNTFTWSVLWMSIQDKETVKHDYL